MYFSTFMLLPANTWHQVVVEVLAEVARVAKLVYISLTRFDWLQ